MACAVVYYWCEAGLTRGEDEVKQTEMTANGLATYESWDFRTYEPRAYRNAEGRTVVMRLCEEFVPESGRWEAFQSIVREG